MMQSLKLKPQKNKTQKPILCSSPETSPAADSTVTVDRSDYYFSVCKWVIPDFKKMKAKTLYSRYFQASAFDFRLLMHPKGDSSATPGHISLYIQINDPSGSNVDCYVTYKFTIVNFVDEAKSLSKESYYRFSKLQKSIGWCEFTVLKSVLDANSGFLKDGSLLVCCEIRVLNDRLVFPSDGRGGIRDTAFLNGKVTWSLRNYGLFKDIVKRVKITSPAFGVAKANLGVNLHTSVVKRVEYLSLFLEIKDIERYGVFDTGCWCLFRISVLNQKPGANHVSRENYGRFGGGGDASIGWTEFMKMSDFIDTGFLVDGNVVITVSFNAIWETSFSFKVEGSPAGKFSKSNLNFGYLGVNGKSGVIKMCDDYKGKIMWKFMNFASFKDILKKKKMKGLCVKSRKYRIGNLEFRLLVYPRGQSQTPLHLSLFLEVLDPGNSSGDWSSFILYRLAVVNGKTVEKSVLKESQGRCSKPTIDYGWSEFMTLTTLFDQDAGYVCNEMAVFTGEVQILKESFVVTDSSNGVTLVTWKVEDFLSLKEIMHSRRIYSKLFEVGGCELRIGFYQSSENLCTYLESDSSIVTDPDKNFWVSYKITMLNQNDPTKSLWKESSLFTKTCTHSSFQFMKVSDMLETDAGFVVHGAVIFVCEIFDCCPWLEFSEPELMALGSVLDGPVSQVKSEASQRSLSAEKAILSLGKITKHLQSNLFKFATKLVRQPLSVPALLDQLEKPETEPALRLPVLTAISQLDLSNEEWERTFHQASQILGDSNHEAVGSTVDLLFKAASQCQSIPQAVKVVRAKLESLATEISPDVLDILRRIMNCEPEIAESMLREVHCSFALDEKSKLLVGSPFPLSKNGITSLDGGIGLVACLQLEDEPLSHAYHRFSDISILVDLLAIPPLTVRASQAFERGVEHGFIDSNVVALVLKKHAQRIRISSSSLTMNYQRESTATESSAESSFLEEFFTSVLTLAEKLSISGNSKVHDFVKLFYATLFKVFTSESYHSRMLRGLVDHATNRADKSSERNLETLVFLIHGENSFARPVLKLMSNAVEHASANSSAIRHRLQTMEEKLIRIQEEKQTQLSKMTREKATLSERLTELEATLLHYKSEMELERDRFTCEKMELRAHVQDVETQLGQLHSKKNDQVAKLCVEKRNYQDRLHHVETQLSQLKSIKEHEAKKLLEENKVLAERLRNAEVERESIDKKLKRYASKVLDQEEARQMQLDQIMQLKQKVEQIERVKQDKEEELAHYRACTYDMEAKLNECQKHIQFIESARRKEMEQHGPLYGVGLESLSIESLENLLHIHEDGIKNIHALKNQARSQSGDLVSSTNPHQNVESTQPKSEPPIASGQSCFHNP